MKSKVRLVLVPVLALLSGTVVAAGASLLRASDYQGKSGEDRLSVTEAKFVVDVRKRAVAAELVKLNPAALDSAVVVMHIRGKDREFVGRSSSQETREDLPGAGKDQPTSRVHTVKTWTGTTQDGAKVMLATGTEAPGAVYGTGVVDGKPFTITNAGGKSAFHVLWEPLPVKVSHGPATPPARPASPPR